MKYYPEFNNRKLTKEKLFKQVLPSGKFSLRRMNNLLSEAYLAIEQFMIFQNLSNDQILQKDLLTKELQQRYLEDSFFKTINKEVQRLEDKPIKDWEDHLALLNLNGRIYHHPNPNPRMQPGGQTIIKMGKQVDLVYLLEKAMIINEKISRNRILKNENHEITKELEKWNIACEDVHHTAIDFYKIRFEYNEENLHEKYMALKKSFLERYEELNEKEQKIHLYSLVNDTALLIKRGYLDSSAFLPIYKAGLKTEIILDNGILSLSNYMKIIFASNSKSDFEFTHHFTNSFTPKLEPLIQADAFQWAIAHTAYKENKLSECLDILLPHNFKIPILQVATRILTTQVYFDLFLNDSSYQEYLFNYFDSFEKWMLRNKHYSKYLKTSYLRFIQVSRSLAKGFTGVDLEINKVKTILENEKNIQAYKWLNQKKEEIIEKRKKRSPK